MPFLKVSCVRLFGLLLFEHDVFLVGGLGDSTIAWTSRWMVKRFDERLVKGLDVCTNHRAIPRTIGVCFF